LEITQEEPQTYLDSIRLLIQAVVRQHLDLEILLQQHLMREVGHCLEVKQLDKIIPHQHLVLLVQQINHLDKVVLFSAEQQLVVLGFLVKLLQILR